MKSWDEFTIITPDLALAGKRLLFPTRAGVGQAFLATIRKDGAPRLHPISLLGWENHLYVFIPQSSPKCADLLRDGRFALQAFPPPDNSAGEEFYLSGVAVVIQDPVFCQSLIAEAGIRVDENERLFELFLERVMYTKLIDRNTESERPWHQIWHT